jgi:hypothetical protein
MKLYTLNSVPLVAGRPFSTGEGDKLVNHPSNWASVWTAEDFARWGVEVTEVPDPEPEPYVPTVADYQDAVEGHVEAVAAQRGYSSSVSCASYVSSIVPQWKAEATAFSAWRDQVWVFALNELLKVQQGQRAVPTVAAFIAELPAMQWPEAPA